MSKTSRTAPSSLVSSGTSLLDIRGKRPSAERADDLSSLSSFPGGSGSAYLSSNEINSSFAVQHAVSTHKVMERESKMLDMSKTRLDFNRLELVGRERERQVLLEAWEGMLMAAEDGSSCRVCLVSGESGSGKTRLALSIRQHIQSKGQGLFAYGKFDRQSLDVPFACIKDIVKSLCRDVADRRKHGEAEISALLHEQIGAELGFLASLFPEITSLVKVDKDEEEFIDPALSQFLERFKYVFRVFLECVVQVHPTAIVIDDIQWADSASAEVLKAVAGSIEKGRLLLIECYRNGQEDMTVDFQEALASIKKMSHTPVVEVQVCSLDQDSIASMLLDLMSIDEKKADSIAGLALEKTGGNIFYVLQFIESLVESKLLRFVSSGEWVVEKDMRNRCSATTNVVELLQAKLDTLRSGKSVIVVAAILGFKFTKASLVAAMQGLVENDRYSSFFQEALGQPPKLIRPEDLQELEQESLIEHIRDGLFKFGHDKVLEAALALVHKDQVLELRFCIGTAVMKKLPEPELPFHLFIVVDLLASRLDLVKRDGDAESIAETYALFYTAGKEAIALSAFDRALPCFLGCISLMPEESKLAMNEFTIDLYSSVVECSLIVGAEEEMRKYADLLLAFKLDMIKVVRVYNVLMDYHQSQDTVGGQRPAKDYGFHVLSQLGCRLPSEVGVRSTLSLVNAILKYKRSRKKWLNTPTHSFKEASRPVDEAVMKTLDKLFTTCYYLAPDLVPLVIQRMVEWTFQHGTTVYSAAAFSFFGFILTYFFNDHELGRSFGLKALELAVTPQCAPARCRAIMAANTLTLHWTTPLEQCTDLLLGEVKFGMAVGDTESCAFCFFHYLEQSFELGRELVALEKDMELLGKKLWDFQRHDLYQSVSHKHQLILNLMGRSDNETLITGVKFDETAAKKRFEESKDLIRLSLVHSNKSIAALYFRDHALGAEIALETWEDSILKFQAGLSRAVYLTYVYAFASYAHFQENGKAKYLKVAKKCHDKLRLWEKQENPNCVQYNVFLEAERLMSNRKRAGAEAKYKEAILLFGRRGILHDRALATERLAELYLADSNNEDAEYYFLEAIEVYRQWGALAKVRKLEARCEGLGFRRQVE